MAKATAYTLIGDQLYKPGDTLPAADGGKEAAGAYADWKVADLKAEIERRNAERDEDGQISADGNKAALTAALDADDADDADGAKGDTDTE